MLVLCHDLSKSCRSAHHTVMSVAETAVSLQPVNSVLPPINLNAPKLTKKGYFTVPPLKRLQRLRDEQLQVLSNSLLLCLLWPWS
jgi:hypothetical protein